MAELGAGALWARYHHEATVTLAAFVSFWAMHLFIRFVVGPMFKVYRDMPRSGVASKKSQIQFEVLIVSFFHCISAVGLGSYVLIAAPPMHPLWGSHPISTLQFAISTGYFLWDLSLFLFYFSEFGLGMFAHAIITSSCFGLGMMPWVQRALSFFLLYELSTLFMDIILFLRVISKDSGLFYTVNGLIFTATFFVVRIIYGTRTTIEFWILWYRELLAEAATPAHLRALVYWYMIMSGGLMLLNFAWFSAIAVEVKRTLFPAKPKRA